MKVGTFSENIPIKNTNFKRKRFKMDFLLRMEHYKNIHFDENMNDLLRIYVNDCYFSHSNYFLSFLFELISQFNV